MSCLLKAVPRAYPARGERATRRRIWDGASGAMHVPPTPVFCVGERKRKACRAENERLREQVEALLASKA